MPPGTANRSEFIQEEFTEVQQGLLADAYDRLVRTAQELKKIDLGVLEFRVDPKYLGFGRDDL